MPLPPEPPPIVLEVLYSPSCAPCRLELPIVAKLIGRQDLDVRIVILDQEARARSELRAVSPELDARARGSGPGTPRDTLRNAGNPEGILPFARSLAEGGKVCAKWSGRLTVGVIKRLEAACGRLATSPPRSPS